MATSCRSDDRSRRLAILCGYNLPILLWTAYALFVAAASSQSGWSCPVRSLTGWCPGCGLTRGYAQFLVTGRLYDWWLGVILTVFFANGIVSVIKVTRGECAPAG